MVGAVLFAATSFLVWHRHSKWQNGVQVIESAGGTVSAQPLERKVRRLLGDDPYPFDAAEGESYRPIDVAVTFGETSNVTPEALIAVGNLPDLESLSLSDRSFAPGELAALKVATNLRMLFLYDTSTDDESLVHLKELEQLEMLGLARTQVTDRGLAELVDLRRLTYLSLNGLTITDAGVEYLCQMSALTELEVTQTGISEEGIERLRIALPNCKIID